MDLNFLIVRMGVTPLLPSSQGYFEDLGGGAKQVGKYTINQAFALAPWAAIWKERREVLQQILQSLPCGDEERGE